RRSGSSGPPVAVAGFLALPRAGLSRSSGRCALHPGTRSRSACPWEDARYERSAPAGSFFKRRHRRSVLTGVPRAGAHVREAKLLEKRTHMALVILDPEPLLDNPLKVDPAPANHPVHVRVGTSLDDLGKFGLLLVRQPRPRTGGPVVE